MHEFSYRKGKLYCEGVDVDVIARKHGTPLYLYSKKTVEDHYRRLHQALTPLDHLICYAVKANSNLSLLASLAQLKSGFDIVSGGELMRVVKAGGDAARCVFAGVGKTEEEIRLALKLGIYCFNVESEAELYRINRIAGTMGKKAPIALRVNPNIEAKTHSKITTGTYENKFGIAYEHIEDIYERASLLPHLKLVGIQMHIGSQITTVAPFGKAIRKMLPLVKTLRDRYQLKFFSIGGGIGIIYRPALESGHLHWWDPKHASSHRMKGRSSLPLTIDLYARTLLPLLKPLGMKIMLEPGRYMVGNAGILVTKVEYLKKTGRKNFIIVDAAMNDLIRPAFYDSYHQIVPVREHPKNTQLVKCDVVGPICESGDYFAKDRDMVPVREGDFVALMSAGAYGYVMASNYNTRPRPPELLISGRQVKVAKPRETLSDMLRGEKV